MRGPCTGVLGTVGGGTLAPGALSQIDATECVILGYGSGSR